MSTKSEPKSPNWRKDLRQSVDTLLAGALSDVKYTKEAGIDVWSVETNNYRYSLALQYGKTAAIAELKITFYKLDKKANFSITDPDAPEHPWHPTWKTTKHMAKLSENTGRIMDKNRYLHWLLSPTKEWIYVDTKAQCDYLADTIMPEAIVQFKKFIAR